LTEYFFPRIWHFKIQTVFKYFATLQSWHIPLRNGSWNRWRIMSRGKKALRCTSKQNAHSTSCPRGGCSIRWWFVRYLFICSR